MFDVIVDIKQVDVTKSASQKILFFFVTLPYPIFFISIAKTNKNHFIFKIQFL